MNASKNLVCFSFSFTVETSSPLEYTLTKLLGLLYYLISMHDIENVLGWHNFASHMDLVVSYKMQRLRLMHTINYKTTY